LILYEKEGNMFDLKLSETPRSVLETLPPAYAVCCSHCGKSFPLRSRLTKSIHIRCADCGKLFQAPAGAPTPAAAVAGTEEPGPELRRGRSRPEGRGPVATIKKRVAWIAAVAGTAFLFGLLSPSMFEGSTRHQWDIEAGVAGGKRATFALYGTSEERIEFVYSSFDGGPFSADSTWSVSREEAHPLPADDGKSGFPLGVGFNHAGESWEIRFCGEGRARVDAGGKVFSGTVVRSVLPK
jgi:hypothetical protein